MCTATRRGAAGTEVLAAAGIAGDAGEDLMRPVGGGFLVSALACLGHDGLGAFCRGLPKEEGGQERREETMLLPMSG